MGTIKGLGAIPVSMGSKTARTKEEGANVQPFLPEDR
jgi:hypothetical protein